MEAERLIVSRLAGVVLGGNFAALSVEKHDRLVAWQSTYESSNEDAVAEFCNPIYVALLDAMKKHFS